MKPELKIDAEAVGALVIARGNPHVFLGVTHTCYSEISEKLPSQVSFPTETKHPGEPDENALGRMLREEELFVEGVSDTARLADVHLATSTLVTRLGVARLRIYGFRIDLGARMRILDGEIAQAGWVFRQTASSAPEGSWWVRWPVADALDDIEAWSSNPTDYNPRNHLEHKHRVPTGVFELLDGGSNEREVLAQLGLHSPKEPLPWSFARL